MMLLSRALALRVLYGQSFAATQRFLPALMQTRVNISPSPSPSPPSTINNRLAVVIRQLHNTSSSPYVDSDGSTLAFATKMLKNSQMPQPNRKLSLGKLLGVALKKRKAGFIVNSDTELDGQSSKKVVKGGKETPTSLGAAKGKVGATRDSKSGGGVSFMGLDKAQMERERLERLSMSARGAQGGDWDEKEVNLTYMLGGTRVRGTGKESVRFREKRRSKPMGLPFPNGTVKKTWVSDVQRDGTEIKLEEVLEEETLYGAVLSTHEWNKEWVLSKIPNGKLRRLVFVMHAKSNMTKRSILNVLGELPETTVVFPSLEGLGCMHSKLMLLFHRREETGEGWLRVVVPSGNLTDYDWGERGATENTVFLIDLPKLSTPKTSNTQFATSLYNFCDAKGMPFDVLKRLSNYNYSATKGMAFVHSICGIHYEEEKWKNTGYPGLGTAIKNLGYSSGKDLEVDLVASSLGATQYDFVMNMYNAAMGFDGSGDLARRPPPALSHPQNHKNLNRKPIKKPGPKGKGKKQVAKVEEPKVVSDKESDVGLECDEETSWERVKERFRIYFPSKDTVVASKGGLRSGKRIYFVPDIWERDGYPKEIVKDCVSAREGVLMHNKMLFARPAKELDTPVGKVNAWAYIGSADFSESAWGKLVICRGKWIPKIKCKNWECGVVVPVVAKPKSGETLSGKAPEEIARTVPLGMEVFGDVVPVPMKTPGESLHPEKTPWYYYEAEKLIAEDAKNMPMRPRIIRWR